MEDNIYFKDKNKGKFKEVTTEYTDCKGDLFCVTVKESLPYIQENEILAPVDLDFSLNNSVFYSGKISIDTYKRKGITYLHCNMPFKVKDIFKVAKSNKRYYIKSKLKYKDKTNNFIYIIKRVDEYPIVSIDLDGLKKNKVIFITGYFGGNK